MMLLRKQDVLKAFSFSYSALRSAHFAVQGAFLPLAELLATGRRSDKPVGYSEYLLRSLPKLGNLLKRDAENIAQGVYPIQVLRPESPVLHLTRIPTLFASAYTAARRRKQKKSKQFNEALKEMLTEVPEYYRRNFHFQTDGYLAESSANLYDHQVEVLFSGSADAMRRSAIPGMKKYFSHSQGKGLEFLEIGCGTGALTKAIALAFPKARITCVDLSSFYLNKAAENLKGFSRISYVQGTGESLKFKDASFDAVFSCFLFHEIPSLVRSQMIKEGKRVLKKPGFYSVTDSIQLDDDPDFNWALEQFPKDFHEPFYKDYIRHPLEKMIESHGAHSIASEVAFLTKTVSGVFG